MCLQRNESPVGTFINSPVSLFYSPKFKVSGFIKKGGIFSFLAFTWNWRHGQIGQGQTDLLSSFWEEKWRGEERGGRRKGRKGEKRVEGRERDREREKVRNRGRWKGPRSSVLSWILPEQSDESLLLPHVGSCEWSINTDNGNGHSKTPPAKRREEKKHYHL